MQLYAFGKEPLTSAMVGNTHISKEDREKYSKYINMEMLPSKYHKKRVPPEVSPTTSGNVKGVDTSVFLNPYFSPLLASDNDLRKLPNTYVMTADIDALRDDGFLLASRMKSLGLDLDHEHMEGLEHGFVLFFYYDSALDYIENYSTYLKKNL